MANCEPPPQPPAPHAHAQVASRAATAAGAALALGALAGCNPLQDALRGPGPSARFGPLPADAGAGRLAACVLNRMAFGSRPGDVSRVAAMGIGPYIEEQIEDNFAEDPVVTWRVNSLDVHQAEEDAPDELSSLGDDQLLSETQQAAILRAVYSAHRLRAALGDFWTNHFNIYALKSEGPTLLPVDAERVIRPHALGNFRDLLFASARSPAMLTYLDNRLNRRGTANENYAREVMELHTVGVHSGYTQRDIQEVARCFTGWTVLGGFFDGAFRFEPTLHDFSAKYIPFLNLQIPPGGGMRDAEEVLERLAVHPATAKHLATQLAMRFLGCAPPHIVEAAARAYSRNDTSIRAALRPILLDGLRDPALRRPIFKRPLDFAVSALRALSADTDGGRPVQRRLAAMGQPLYQWPMPDGFPTKTAAWTSSLLPRWEFGLALAANAIPGTTVDLNQMAPGRAAPSPARDLDALLEAIYSQPADSEELRAVRSSVRRHMELRIRSGAQRSTLLAEAAGLLLAAPAFQWM